MLFRISVISLWHYLDSFFLLFRRLEYIFQNQDEKTVFRVRITKYKGKSVHLSDGTIIAKNDCLLKIHLHNVRIIKEVLSVKNPLQRSIVVYRMVEQSMPALARFIETHPMSQHIKGIVGITMLNKGVKYLGFEKVYPENRIYKIFKLTTQFPIFFLSSTSLTIKHIKSQRATYLFMSKEKLINKYIRNQ